MSNAHDLPSIGNSPVARVLDRLQRVKRRGPSRWTASCPTAQHPRGDRSAGLSIAEGADGRALVYCFAGCDLDDILAAIRLESRDLFVPRDDDLERPRKRVCHAPLPRSVAQVILEAAEHPVTWASAQLLARLESALAKQDLLSSWDALADRIDIPETLRLARLIRGVAMLRYCDSKSVEDPRAITRAIERLVFDLGLSEAA